MQNSNKHIINKVFLEINTNSKEKGYYLKDNMDAFLQKEVFALLESYFNEWDSKNASHSLQLDKLNLDIAINQNLDFEDFKNQILKKITTQVEEVFKNENATIEGYKLIKPQEKEIESFFYFLETGTNAWWKTSNHDAKIVDDAVFDEILNDVVFSIKWTNAVQKPIVRTRLIKQFTDSQIVNIIKKGILLKKNNTESNTQIIKIEAIKKHIETNSAKNLWIPNQRFLMWEIVILSLLGTSDTVLKQKLSRLIGDVFEFHKKNLFLQHKELFLQEIKNQIENQNPLELLANLDVIISIIEKKLDKIILEETEIETSQRNQASLKTKKEIKTEEEIVKQTKIENEIEIKNEVSIEDETEIKNEAEIEDKAKTNEAEIEASKIQESNEKTAAEAGLILEKNKEESLHGDDQDIEILRNSSKEKTINNQEEAIEEKDSSFEKEKDKKENLLDVAVSDSYVGNAGLVLVHPFLKSLFENCKLLHIDNTINNPEVAAHLLHYVATGQEQDYENAMVFEKFLCNIPLTEPIERNIVLSEEMKKEAATMLQAVLSNWDIMKTSTVELLQNEFLQRPGKLNSNGDESPTIIIERKTQDVLLDQLSWNLSIIKLAWKKRIIYVNW
ncbi:MAG: hypothetical protein J7574_11835 [Flavobacterium sp.]|uniref:contractile injection system tape measure protein n=1 Tax=Flavobacterium sp. TaxID=239 RepID=UPI001B12A44E|nr:contractile injection system tape measure protein [Flavobacterium sp.]MBO9584840.1 hypothetical protein [Flavobacterium sp.]